MENILLPNGKYVQVEEGLSQEEKNELINSLSAEDLEKPEAGGKEEAGLLKDTPDALKNSWLFDNAVVAPYEGSRKYINSGTSLIEDIGDTLGKATNIGGFRYGKDAVGGDGATGVDGVMEYVNYEQAVKDKNVSGILAPVTGNIGVEDSWKTKGFFYDPSKDNPEDNTETLVGSFVESGVQFLIGYATGGVALKGAKAVTNSQRIAKATVQGSIGDFIAFDENSGRFTDMVIQHFPSLEDTWVGYLGSKEDDTWYEGRWKNSLEGIGLGGFAEILFLGGKVAKNKLFGKNVEADEKIISEAQQAIINSKDALDNAVSISEKMKIVNKALEPVLLKSKSPKNKLNPNQQTILLNDVIKKDMVDNYDKWKAGELSAEEAFSLPRAWINLDTFDKDLVDENLNSTLLKMQKSIEQSYKEIPTEFANETIRRNSLEYTGDLNRTFTEFDTLAKTTKNTSPLVFAHDITLNSMIKALPAMQRQVVSGERSAKQVNQMMSYIMNMIQNRKTFASNTGSNLNTLGITKKEFQKIKVIEENLENAFNEFNYFAGKSTKEQDLAKQKLLAKIAIADNPTLTRRVLNFALGNKTWEVLNEIWINALLSNPKTQLVNTVGNAITAVAKPLEDRMGSKISQYLSGSDISKAKKYQAMADDAVVTMSGIFEFLGSSLKMGAKAFWKNDLILEGSQGRSKIDTGTTSIRSDSDTIAGKTINKAGDIIRLPSRFLNAGDEVAKQLNYRSKLRSQAVREAKSEGLKGKKLDEFVDQYMRDGYDEYGRGTNLESLEYAREATYTNDLTGFTKKFQEAINEYPILKQAFPFIRTPFQLAKSIVDRSPLALGYRTKHLLGISNDPRMIAKARGQAAMGTVLFTSAYVLGEMGMLNSATNKTTDDGKVLDKFKDAELMRLKKSEENFKPYSFVIGKTQIPFGRLDPYGAFFGMVADIKTNYAKLEQKEIEEIGANMQLFLFNQLPQDPLDGKRFGMGVKATASALRDNLLSKTYFQAVYEIVNALYSNDDITVKRYFTNKLGSFYPNVTSKIINDPYLRNARTMLEEASKRTGLGTPPDPKFNFMGEPHKNREGGVERLFNNFISPVTATTRDENPLSKELLRLGKAPENLKDFQNNVDYSQYKNGKVTAHFRLNNLLSTGKVYDDIIGKEVTLREKLTHLVQSDLYKGKSDPIKIGKGLSDGGGKFQLIKNIYDVYLRNAHRKFLKEKHLYKNIDDDRQTLLEDERITKNNYDAIKQPNRTNNSLNEQLQAIGKF